MKCNTCLQIIHIDGAFAREKHVTSSNSNISFDLIIGTNTDIHLIKEGPNYSDQNSPKQIPVTTIEKATDYNKSIRKYIHLFMS